MGACASSGPRLASTAERGSPQFFSGLSAKKLMLRALATRRALLASIPAAALAAHETRDKPVLTTTVLLLSLKSHHRPIARRCVPASPAVGRQLPIYPAPEPELILVEAPLPLEAEIGVARRAVTQTLNDAHARVQAVVSRWIGVEQAVEHRLKSLVAPDEPLTPGLLYAGVAGLTGSILARNRSIALRASLPPLLFTLAFARFLPHTASNVRAYLSALEDAYAPRLAEVHATANAHAAMTWARAREGLGDARAGLEGAVEKGLGRVEEATGLKLRAGLGVRAEGEPERLVVAKAKMGESVRELKTDAAAVGAGAVVKEVAVEAGRVGEAAVQKTVEEVKEAGAAAASVVSSGKEEAKQEVKEVKEEQPPKRLV
ncbi:hypothetical protein OBBRIDRAFT_835851 [Obba rivulosa]|uniref:MICOS complex subunit n=1 Tax=Obba rivulosa TaxID=1052685 RepID=A0A8E2DJT6_9APHY|nr:hypothetical protein OBBRIDRAFT_835851 [Obba rivulosa]